MTTDSLNTAERIQANINNACVSMAKIEDALGSELFTMFTQNLSSLFRHMNPATPTPGLMSNPSLKCMGPKLCIYLISACGEFQNAWNVLKLGSVPGALRTARVAFEFISIGALVAAPVRLLKQCKWKDGMQNTLEAGGWSLFDLFNAKIDLKRGIVVPPIIKSMKAPKMFMTLLESLVDFDQSISSTLSQYREELHNPYSHGSTQSWSQAFLASDGRVAGQAFQAARIPVYRDCAKHLIHMVALSYQALNGLNACLNESTVQTDRD